MRPTTKDLAKAAGVSLATVDRVLNGRAGVKRKTVERVNKAIAEIGFVRNISAANLARQKSYRFAFVVPEVGDQFLDEILNCLEEANQAFASEMIAVDVQRVDETDPHIIVQHLRDLTADEVDGVAIMAPATPQLRDAIVRAEERGIHPIAFISNQTGSVASGFVGIDNFSAGRTAGKLMGRFAGQSQGSIMVIGETMQSRDSLERRFGFDSVINVEFPNLNVLPSLETHGDPERTRDVVKNAIESNTDLVGIYVLSPEARLPLEAVSESLRSHELIKIVHERTPFTVASLESNEIDAVIAQSPGHLVRSAIRILRAKCDNRETLASQEKIRIEILLKENL